MYLEIQQLKKLGLNKSQIARRLGISRNTVYKYINMTPEEFEDMLEHMEVRQKKLDCIKEKLITWLKQYPDISSAQIHDWIKERYPDLTVGESTVRCYVSQLRKEYSIPKIKTTRQYEAVEDTPMGQQMQVDFGQGLCQVILGLVMIPIFQTLKNCTLFPTALRLLAGSSYKV